MAFVILLSELLLVVIIIILVLVHFLVPGAQSLMLIMILFLFLAPLVKMMMVSAFSIWINLYARVLVNA